MNRYAEKMNKNNSNKLSTSCPAPPPNKCDIYDSCNYNTRIRVDYLASNLPYPGAIVDPVFVNSWGIIILNNNLWIVNSNSGTIVYFDQHQQKIIDTIYVTNADSSVANPSGIVANNSVSAFVIRTNGLSAPATWITATNNGTICAFSPVTNTNSRAQIVVDRSNIQAVYKGIAIINDKIYAPDFHNGVMNVFDKNFTLISSLSGKFVDNTIPAGFVPFNVANINGLLYVTYGLQKGPENVRVQHGLGNGYINIFSSDGQLVRRLVSRGVLNSPYAVILAPKSFGLPTGTLLVGNFGDGLIHIFSQSGTYRGLLKNTDGSDLYLEGICGITSGAEGTFFTSDPGNTIDGVVGQLIPLCALNT